MLSDRHPLVVVHNKNSKYELDYIRQLIHALEPYHIVNGPVCRSDGGMQIQINLTSGRHRNIVIFCPPMTIEETRGTIFYIEIIAPEFQDVSMGDGYKLGRNGYPIKGFNNYEGVRGELVRLINY